MSANDGGPHYYCGGNRIQTWDYIASHHLNFFEGNIVKYITRYKSKNGIEDLRKAQHYLTKLIELQGDREGMVAS